MIATVLFCASMLVPLADQATDNKTEQAIENQTEESELLPIEVNVVSYTNSAREQHGLPPLEVDEKLMKSARNHCSWMTWYRNFTHSCKGVAENIAMGQPDSNAVVRAWMNSSGHRANILNPNHRRIGVSAYRTESGTIYWCQQFTR